MSDPGPGPRTSPGKRIGIIGAGPAGLTAAYLLARSGAYCTVYESDAVVGGLSRTVDRDGWLFDIGGHRFFTKVTEVSELWREMLGDENFMVRPRLSRIYYRGKMFDYPLRAFNALSGLGLVETARCLASYARAQVRPPRDLTTFEGWVTSRFGHRLYSIFFKTYTEKVWGMPADQIQADWAVQRIKNLSLLKAIVNALALRRGSSRVTSLIEEFHYPKRGPGMMWERAHDLVLERGSDVLMNTAVTAIDRDPETGRVTALHVRSDDGDAAVEVDEVISSMPLSELVLSMHPPAPGDVVNAARALRYRDFLTVAVVVPDTMAFPDNWIYIHDPGVQVGRIQNFGSWSPHMVKDGRTCLGLEYFVSEGDALWMMSDDDLVSLARKELEALGLVPMEAIEIGYVVRMHKAYPVYDAEYLVHVQQIRDWLASAARNVHPVGRNGMHKYNNQDHSMVTAIHTVANILYGGTRDVWSVNVDADYQEEIQMPGERRKTRRTGRAG